MALGEGDVPVLATLLTEVVGRCAKELDILANNAKAGMLLSNLLVVRCVQLEATIRL